MRDCWMNGQGGMESPDFPIGCRVQGVCLQGTVSAQFEDIWSGSQREELCVEEGAGDSGKGKPLDLDEKLVRDNINDLTVTGTLDWSNQKMGPHTSAGEAVCKDSIER